VNTGYGKCLSRAFPFDYLIYILSIVNFARSLQLLSSTFFSTGSSTVNSTVKRKFLSVSVMGSLYAFLFIAEAEQL
jgi:hypothetical protein